MTQRSSRSSSSVSEAPAVAALIAALAVLVPLPCLADNLGAIGMGAAILLLTALLVLSVMIVFIVLAVVLYVRARAGKARGAGVLVIVTRLLAILWYLAALAPIVFNLAVAGGHDVDWTVMFCLVGGAPAHVASIIALVMARRLARVPRR